MPLIAARVLLRQRVDTQHGPRIVDGSIYSSRGEFETQKVVFK